ncbi:MAG: hypothetical protein AB7T10_05810 [bacterium]
MNAKGVRFFTLLKILFKVFVHDAFSIFKNLFSSDETDKSKTVKLPIAGFSENHRRLLKSFFYIDVNINSVLITREAARIVYVNYKSDSIILKRFDSFVKMVKR